MNSCLLSREGKKKDPRRRKQYVQRHGGRSKCGAAGRESSKADGGRSTKGSARHVQDFGLYP